MPIRRTKNIPASVIRDAMSVAGGLYRMNAPSAAGYAFNAGETEVGCGEFVVENEVDGAKRNYDGYIDFATKTLTDNRSGEARSLA